LPPAAPAGYRISIGSRHIVEKGQGPEPPRGFGQLATPVKISKENFPYPVAAVVPEYPTMQKITLTFLYSGKQICLRIFLATNGQEILPAPGFEKLG
jgi:hypothetical protein